MTSKNVGEDSTFPESSSVPISSGGDRISTLLLISTQHIWLTNCEMTRWFHSIISH